MRKTKAFKQEHEALKQKYARLFGELSELKYALYKYQSEAEHVRSQDGEIRELHRSMRRLKHDMKNHLMVMASYLNNNEYDEAKAYMSEMLDKLNTMHSYIETGNSLMNHIINEKLAYAKENGIDVKAEIENLSFAKMKSIDFSALLNNMLDNAIEASLHEEKPQLKVEILSKKGYEVIAVKNRISVSVLDANPLLETTKEDKNTHGMGTVQIEKIVEQYDGMCDFYEEDGFFCVTAFIPQ